VESQGEVVDAFLMLFTEGSWQRGAYAVAGEAVLADKQLCKLQTAIRIDLDRQARRSREHGPSQAGIQAGSGGEPEDGSQKVGTSPQMCLGSDCES
jgi:hypothetical protein